MLANSSYHKALVITSNIRALSIDDFIIRKIMKIKALVEAKSTLNGVSIILRYC